MIRREKAQKDAKKREKARGVLATRGTEDTKE